MFVRDDLYIIMKNMNSKGFTLLELLVTMGVVSILSGIAMANFQQYKAAAHDVSAKVLQRNLTTAVETWISVDWNQTSWIQMHWWGWADGTEEFDAGNIGQELTQFMGNNLAQENMRFAIGVNTGCFFNTTTCGSSYRAYAWAGHCQVETVAGIYHKVHQYWNLNTGDIAQTYTSLTLAQSKCP